MQQTLIDFLRANGCEDATALPLDGQFHHFDRAGGSLNASFKASTLGSGFIRAYVKDHRTGEVFRWKSSDAKDWVPLSPEAAAQQQAELDAQDRAAEKLAKERQTQAVEECLAIWNNSVDRGSSPYFTKKGLPEGELFGCRLDLDTYEARTFGPQTLVPLSRWENGQLSFQGCQRISADGKWKLPLREGLTMPGVFHILGGVPTSHILLCEGIATAARVWLATGLPTVVCFNAGGLLPVARSMRERYPQAKLTVCADNDVDTESRIKRNPGLAAAAQISQKLGAAFIYPVFTPEELKEHPKWSDWDDFAQARGFEAMRIELLALLKQGPGAGAQPDPEDIPQPEGGIQAVNGNGIPTAPRQQRVVNFMLDVFQGKVIKQNRDLFVYTGTYWRMLKPEEHDKIKVSIQKVCNGLADVKHIDSSYKLLLYHLPSPPLTVDLYAPNPFCANFLNGTLHLVRGPDRKRALEFRPHRREDYVVNVLPYHYEEDSQERNEEFEGMLQRVFQGDADIDEKIRAVRQMYGACLMPAFPRLFMHHGRPGTGKSSVINVATRLVHKDNLSHVPPNKWQGFGMESMVGKLVNSDTDVPTTAPMVDDMLKKVIERKPFLIRRKGVKDINAPIPSVHMFGGNDIPKTLDTSGAHERRWTFLSYQAFVPKGEYEQEYWDYCFEVNPLGVLRFAIEGLKDLIARNGHFVQPGSGAETMTEWQLRGDVVGQFLADIQDGEIVDGSTRVLWGEKWLCSRSNTWKIFSHWMTESGITTERVGKKEFFRQLRLKKIVEYRTKEGRYFAGFGTAEKAGGIC